MKPIATILLLSGLLWAQSQPMPEYPLTLTVTSAQVSKNATGTTTQIIGYLSEGSLQQQVHIVCKGATFSPSPDGKANTYPARYAYSHNPVQVAAQDDGHAMKGSRCQGGLSRRQALPPNQIISAMMQHLLICRRFI